MVLTSKEEEALTKYCLKMADMHGLWARQRGYDGEVVGSNLSAMVAQDVHA